MVKKNQPVKPGCFFIYILQKLSESKPKKQKKPHLFDVALS
jgi:hypothetical protein